MGDVAAGAQQSAGHPGLGKRSIERLGGIDRSFKSGPHRPSGPAPASRETTPCGQLRSDVFLESSVLGLSGKFGQRVSLPVHRWTHQNSIASTDNLPTGFSFLGRFRSIKVPKEKHLAGRTADRSFFPASFPGRRASTLHPGARLSDGTCVAVARVGCCGGFREGRHSCESDRCS